MLWYLILAVSRNPVVSAQTAGDRVRVFGIPIHDRESTPSKQDSIQGIISPPNTKLPSRSTLWAGVGIKTLWVPFLAAVIN